MPPWSSWLPGLPSINLALPSSLQGRFISFLLKKSLGHLLKPGQLDTLQIDSQIGSGYVQINNLELDNEVISNLLSDLPVVLHDGFISSVKARIPWPNPLTSTLGFSLDSLHLTFHLSSQSNELPQFNVNLADSVASVAESFMHDELTPQEESTLWESFHPDLASPVHKDTDFNVPGSLDPFLSAPETETVHSDVDPAGVSIFATLIERLLARFEFDAVDTKIKIVHPGNMSLTATILEVRYRTESIGVDTHETPHGSQSGSRTVSITGVNVTARDLRPRALSTPPSAPLVPNILSSDSPSSSHLSFWPPKHNSRSASPSSSSSSLDEETQFLMSQSLAFLPPRPSSPTSSVVSSMYQSAFSMAPAVIGEGLHSRSRSGSRSASPSFVDHDILDAPPLPPNSMEHQPEKEIQDNEEVILSLGSIPILLRLTTPSWTESPMGMPTSSQIPPLPGNKNGGENLRLSISAGVIACAFRAWHIRGISCLADNWSRYSRSSAPVVPMNTDSRPSATRPLWLDATATVQVRGLAFLVLLSSSSVECSLDLSQNKLLSDFYKRPLVPPSLPFGYLRLYLDGISGSASSVSHGGSPGVLSGSQEELKGPKVSSATTNTLSVALFISDISLFSFHSIPTSSGQDPELGASPILITDHNLAAQYAPTYPHPEHTQASEVNTRLLSFEVMDWTDEKHQHNGMKLAHWRSKLKRRRDKATLIGQNSEGAAARTSPSSQVGGTGVIENPDVSPSNPLPPAISIGVGKASPPSSPHIHQKAPANHVEISLVPLHIFLDLGLAFRNEGILEFLSGLIGDDPDHSVERPRSNRSERDEGDHDADSDDAEVDTPPASPRARSAKERETERLRLERLVIQDLGLDLDYDVKEAAAKAGMRKSKPSRKQQASGPQEVLSVSVKFDMVRLQIRCQPPSGHAPRSGAFVLDLHDVRVTTRPVSVGRGTRFTDADPFKPTAASKAASEISLIGAEVRRIVLACSPIGERLATSFLSLEPLNTSTDVAGNIHEGSQSGADMDLPPPLQPRITTTKLNPNSKQSSSIMTLNVDIPSIHIDVSKHILDSLQYWMDDVAQLIDRTFDGVDDTKKEKLDSRDTSLIGSRFFAKSRSGSGSGSGLSTTTQQAGSGTVVRVAISESFVRLMLPRIQDESAPRPFLIHGSDLDILIELKPEGKDATVLTLRVMDLTIKDTSVSGVTQTFFSLTAPRSLSSAPSSMTKLRFTSLMVPETTAKESKVKLTLSGFTYNFFPDIGWISDLETFIKSPPGTFESVIPSERTRISLKVVDGSIRAFAPTHPGAMVAHIGDLNFSTDVVGDSPASTFRLSIPALALLAIDDASDYDNETVAAHQGAAFWKNAGFALLADIADMDTTLKKSKSSDTHVMIDRMHLRVHLCADSLAAVTAFTNDLGSAFKPPMDERTKSKRGPTMVSMERPNDRSVMASVDDLTFKRIPDVGPAPDMINDDLPTNLDYLDESFGAAAGLRELRDEDLDEFDDQEMGPGEATTLGPHTMGVISRVGGETIKIFRPEGINTVENYFDTLPPDASDETAKETTHRLRVHDSDITLFLYDGYDWVKTRKTIEEEIKEMRRRLAKIRQLVASGQTQDSSAEETSALLFNSVYIGLEQDVDELESEALIAAIDEELRDDVETVSQSSWQSLKPPSAGKKQARSSRVHGKRLTRSKGPSIEFRLSGLKAEIDQYRPDEPIVSRTFATVKDLEILDHIKTSTWKKFLTELRSDSRGNVRETDSNMVRIELRSVRPVPGHPSEESRLRAKILPLRLYVDQDAVDFLKKFFSFKDPQAPLAPGVDTDGGDVYFQLAEVFPVDLKLDYKPRRVDYRALREGKTIELMNFFHFDGAEMTLRHITLSGVTGWPRLFEMLNDLWTPDVKATQLVEVISGVAPIRSMVNVGSGVADLVLLPIAQYKKDGRIVRGVQKGTTAFVKSTAIEAIKLGARLATGTQVILEQAEGVLGGQFKHPITTEAVQGLSSDDVFTQQILDGNEDESTDPISKYAQQPVDIKEGMQSAYRSLQKNFNSAAQTILAVPMEVYERSGNEGPVRSVIRAVPIAVLKPMIGASEAVSKTLLGLHNSLDPNVRHDNEAKYKRR